jgi:2-amino-4-hydroxy-6-hydroxymethyldihydropteridine diphosphokinase
MSWDCDREDVRRSPFTDNLQLTADNWMRCGIGLGSNIEDRLANLREGCKRICSLHEPGPPIRFSSICETTPVDCEPGTMLYLNAVIEINFAGAPVALLDQLLEIERAMGRMSKRPRNSPRAIDLDVLYAGNLVLNSPEMILPHPRLQQRRFVLTPLAEISPDLVLPGQTRSVRRLLAELDDPGQVTQLGFPLFDRE